MVVCVFGFVRPPANADDMLGAVLLRRVAGEVYSRVHGWAPTILRISN
jgi:hypothetical protein